MKSTRIFAVSVGLLGALSIGSGQALALELGGYGTFVNSGTAGNCPSFCTGSAFADQSNGDAGAEFASAVESTYGIARGSARFASDQSYLPELKAYAESAVGKRATATSFASQLFTFSGAEARNINLQVNLTGSVFENAFGYSSSGINASIAVVRGSNIPWYPSFGTLIFEAVSAEDRLALGDAFINVPGITSAQANLSFNLTPGESFFVVTQLTASSGNGVANAENTLKMNFDNAAGLVAITAVPEAEGLWMAGAGLMALGLWAPRRRKSSPSAVAG
jgi:hypothetical protein